MALGRCLDDEVTTRDSEGVKAQTDRHWIQDVKTGEMLELDSKDVGPVDRSNPHWMMRPNSCHLTWRSCNWNQVSNAQHIMDHGLVAVLDSGCSKTVAGEQWLVSLTGKGGQVLQTSTVDAAFSFGDGPPVRSSKLVSAQAFTDNKQWVVHVCIVANNVPLLSSKSAIALLGAHHHYATNTMGIDCLDLRGYPMKRNILEGTLPLAFLRLMSLSMPYLLLLIRSWKFHFLPPTVNACVIGSSSATVCIALASTWCR